MTEMTRHPIPIALEEMFAAGDGMIWAECGELIAALQQDPAWTGIGVGLFRIYDERFEETGDETDAARFMALSCFAIGVLAGLRAQAVPELLN